MQKNKILNGFEGVAPLPMRSQNFFDQVQIFKREPQLLGTGGQEIHLVGSVRLRLPTSEDEGADGGLLSRNGNGDDLLKLFALKYRQHHFRQSIRPKDGRTRLIGHTLNRIANRDGATVTQEIRRYTDMLENGQPT